MNPGDHRPHQEVLRPECIAEYEAAHADIYHRLIHINTSIQILETIASFPLKRLSAPDEPFFATLCWNFTYTCIVMLHALLEESKSSTIAGFKKRLLCNWLPEHEQQALKNRLRTARFSKEGKRIKDRATTMRHKVIAHRDREVVSGSFEIPGLSIPDLRMLYSETEALFAACCFHWEYVASLYPGGTVGGKPVERDIGRFMTLLLRDSYWLTEPERKGPWWTELRKRMSQANLDELNLWRVRLGLAEA